MKCDYARRLKSPLKSTARTEGGMYLKGKTRFDAEEAERVRQAAAYSATLRSEVPKYSGNKVEEEGSGTIVLRRLGRWRPKCSLYNLGGD